MKKYDHIMCMMVDDSKFVKDEAYNEIDKDLLRISIIFLKRSF